MKNLISFIVLFLGLTVFSFAQTGITFHIKSVEGNIFKFENETYSISFGISGISSDAQLNEIKTTMKSDSNVRNFETFKKENGILKARLVLLSKDKEKLKALFIAAKVKTINVNGKDYPMEQFDKMIEELKANSAKKK